MDRITRLFPILLFAAVAGCGDGSTAPKINQRSGQPSFDLTQSPSCPATATFTVTGRCVPFHSGRDTHVRDTERGALCLEHRGGRFDRRDRRWIGRGGCGPRARCERDGRWSVFRWRYFFVAWIDCRCTQGSLFEQYGYLWAGVLHLLLRHAWRDGVRQHLHDSGILNGDSHARSWTHRPRHSH